MPKTNTDALDSLASARLPRLPFGWRWEGRKLVYSGDKTDSWSKLLIAIAEFEP